jgi:solute carrier family 25 (adenine nucleotide translocator) protein 4/5/6/31
MMPDSKNDKQKNVRELGFLENFVISGAAAVISKTVAAPLERVKLLIQNQDEMLKQKVIQERYRGITDCTLRTYRSEGFWSFWRGNFANCIRYFPTQALNFAFKDKVKLLVHKSDSDSWWTGLGKNVTSGAVAGSLSLCFVYSLDYARTRLANDALSASRGESSNRQFSGLIDVYKQTLRSDGIQGLYRGFVISCVGIFIYRGCYFGFYDSLKPVLLSDDAGLIEMFLLGYAVTVFSEMVSYPADTVRRRMMMTSGQAVKYKGSIDCLTQIVRNEGGMSLMKGAGANVLRGIGGAIVLAGFDELVKVYRALGA